MRKTLVLCALALCAGLLIWKGSSFVKGEPRPSEGLAPQAPAIGDAEQAQDTENEELVTEAARDITERNEAVLAEVETDGALGAEMGALLVRTVLESGDVVPETEVVVTRRNPERLGADILRLETDTGGTVRVELRPGKLSVWSPYGPRASAEIVAGQEVQVELVFKNVVDVHGIVVDPDGAPVAGAQVWLASWRLDWLGLHRATSSGPDGRFEIQHVHIEKSIGASATLRGPSQLTDLSLSDTSSSPVEMRLQLTPDGGDLHGRVSGPGGEAIPGARVAAGESPTNYGMRQDGSQEEQWTARVALTDLEGRYELTGLPTGQVPVVVQTPGYPLLAAKVEIVAGETSMLDLTLERGMSVRGVVRDQAGEPIDRAIVLALDAPFEDPFPTQGPTDRGNPFNRPGVRSAADGHFVLSELPAGQVHLYASKGTSYWDDGDFVGTVQETLSGGPDETLEWNPVLTRGFEIRGRVTYADGTPVRNVFVTAIRPTDERRYTEHADEGHFAIPGLENMAYTVYVQLWDAPENAGRLERENVWPSNSEIVLVASYSKTNEQKGIVHATIADVADRIEGKGAILFAHPRGWYHSDEKDGVFTARLPPGRYQARVTNGDDVVGAGEWFELAAGEERHLGAVYTSPTCGLRVRVVRPAALATSLVFVAVQAENRPKQGGRKLAPDEDEMSFEDLLEGPVVVQLSGKGAAFEKRSLELRAGEPPVVEFTLRPAVSCSFQVVSTQVEGFGRLALVLKDSSGDVYNELEWFERWGAELPLDAKLSVPVGKYTVEATTSSGLSATGELVVESLAATPAMRLELE